MKYIEINLIHILINYFAVQCYQQLVNLSYFQTKRYYNLKTPKSQNFKVKVKIVNLIYI